MKAEPEFSIICHCRACQRITGAGHAAAFAAHVDQTTIEGELNYHERKCETGNTVRNGFCGKCGNPVLNKPSRAPQFLFFHAATLDNPEMFKPEMVVYEAFKQPWDYVDPDIPRR